MFDSYEFNACLRSALLEESARRMLSHYRQMPNAVVLRRFYPDATEEPRLISDDDYHMLLNNLTVAEVYRRERADHWWREIRERALQGRPVQPEREGVAS